MNMKSLNVITLALVIIGGLNWGLMGFFQYDLVASIFGGQDSGGARTIYAIVGLSAHWQIMPWLRALTLDEPRAEQAHRPVR
jgi:uncharacterized membrane protein YuzA (DUF378 family)